MLKVFTAYRKTAALGLCVTAATTALFIAMGEAAFSIFIIVLGLWITWLASLYKAMREHQAMLDVLYQEMDAPRFIQIYRVKLEKAKPGSAFEAAMRAHIGNAYMMMGEYAQALEWFTAACDEPDVKLLMATIVTMGVMTPPVGSALYTVCGILKCPVEEYTKEALPFFLAVMLEMIVLVFFPNVVLFLPNLIYG